MVQVLTSVNSPAERWMIREARDQYSALLHALIQVLNSLAQFWNLHRVVLSLRAAVVEVSSRFVSSVTPVGSEFVDLAGTSWSVVAKSIGSLQDLGLGSSLPGSRPGSVHLMGFRPEDLPSAYTSYLDADGDSDEISVGEYNSNNLSHFTCL
ncbi:Tetratricopeptide repeat [Branchiostoma belcheri]|nr:Tetratricopeptide repeat [Branchiostoma belcheri]